MTEQEIALGIAAHADGLRRQLAGLLAVQEELERCEDALEALRWEKSEPLESEPAKPMNGNGVRAAQFMDEQREVLDRLAPNDGPPKSEPAPAEKPPEIEHKPGVENVTQDQVFDFIAEHGQVRSSDIRKHFGLSRQTVSGKLGRLQKAGRVEGLGRLNDPNGMIYRVKRAEKSPQGAAGAQRMREKYGYNNVSEDKVLEFLKEKGTVTTGDVRQEFGVSRTTATARMMALVARGQARTTGQRAATKYHYAET